MPAALTQEPAAPQPSQGRPKAGRGALCAGEWQGLAGSVLSQWAHLLSPPQRQRVSSQEQLLESLRLELREAAAQLSQPSRLDRLRSENLALSREVALLRSNNLRLSAELSSLTADHKQLRNV